MKRNALRIIIMLMFSAVLFTACNPVTYLSVSRVEFEADEDGFIKFYTNDKADYKISSWALYENKNTDPNTYEIECKKMSGHDEYPYGMIFGGDVDNIFKYYAVLISADGYYRIFKSKSEEENSDEVIKGWKRSDALHTGYHTLNTIKVENAASTYTVYLNGIQIDQFTDAEYSGGNIGFYVSVGSKIDESFPNKPVDVRFRQTHY